MSSIVLAFRLILAVTFATAGAAKLARLEAFRETVAAFGASIRSARYVAGVLPLAELAAAVALLLQPTARWAGVCAELLLLLFTAVIARALIRGETFDCNCFGQLGAEQISWRTLVRNGVLAILAGLVIAEAPGSALTAWTTSTPAANVVAGAAVIAAVMLAVLALNLRQRLAGAVMEAGTGLNETQTLDIGDPAPPFLLPDLDGNIVSLEALLTPGLPVVMVFASPTCAPCTALMPELARWASALGERIKFAVVESGVGTEDDLRSRLPDMGDLTVLVEPGRELAERYLISGTPSAVTLDPHGRLARPIAPGAVGIEGLIRTIVRQGVAIPRQAPVAAA